MTELEYRAAAEHKLPCLIYLKDGQQNAELQQDDPDGRAKLERLKSELRAKHNTVHLTILT
jgi:hypothetical protein